ncbi:glycosyltransferase [Microbacterium sp.]|uniref:glycosyltransferase n=1 Tax=Microbacterium sp. TaxID=51671 RepID=UPI0028126D72|nr:glycosyltransferase [Microbacterium sp.]
MITRRMLVPFPAWEGNPYLSMLTLMTEAAGWRIEGRKNVPDLMRLATELVVGDVVHVHWTSPITRGAANEADAEAKRREFRVLLEGLRARGVRILWTVHNEIAHDAPFPAVERTVARDLAELCDVIIQLHEHTSAFVAESFALPMDKLVTLPHSSYLGVYPDERDDQLARNLLGIPESAPTVGFIGQVRPYKGLDTLMRAVDLAAAEVPDLTLLIAGRVAPEDAPQLAASLPSVARVVLHTEFVRDEDLWKWFRASDVVALPYRRILNSGSILLASTFGRPCIVPDDTPLPSVYADESWVRAYATADADRALADAIVASVRADGVEGAMAEGFARRHTPFEMSRAYRAILADLDAKGSTGT